MLKDYQIEVNYNRKDGLVKKECVVKEIKVLKPKVDIIILKVNQIKKGGVNVLKDDLKYNTADFPFEFKMSNQKYRLFGLNLHLPGCHYISIVLRIENNRAVYYLLDDRTIGKFSSGTYTYNTKNNTIKFKNAKNIETKSVLNRNNFWVKSVFYYKVTNSRKVTL